MQNLTGTSSGNNNKSCRIIHNGSNKIGFAFLWFFYNFIRVFKVSANLEETDLWTDPRISQTGPREENLDCNWVPGAMAGGGSSIPVRGRLGSAGKWRGSAQGLTYDRFRGLDGSEGVWRGGSAVAGSSCRWSFCSGGGEAPAWCPMTRGGGVGSCGVARTLGRWW
jgi:hypothetical protein